MSDTGFRVRSEPVARSNTGCLTPGVRYTGCLTGRQNTASSNSAPTPPATSESSSPVVPVRSSLISSASSSDQLAGADGAERDAAQQQRHHVLVALALSEDEEPVLEVIGDPRHRHHADDARPAERRQQPEHEQRPCTDLGEARQPRLQHRHPHPHRPEPARRAGDLAAAEHVLGCRGRASRRRRRARATAGRGRSRPHHSSRRDPRAGHSLQAGVGDLGPRRATATTSTVVDDAKARSIDARRSSSRCAHTVDVGREPGVVTPTTRRRAPTSQNRTHSRSFWIPSWTASVRGAERAVRCDRGVCRARCAAAAHR